MVSFAYTVKSNFQTIITKLTKYLFPMAITDEITNNFTFLYVKKNSVQPVGYVDLSKKDSDAVGKDG